MEMLCIMHEAEPYGSLRINGKNISDRQLASLAGGEIDGLLTELEDAGVFSRDDDGAIVSRRMQRDKVKADTDKANGKRGGNPGLRNRVNPPVNRQDKAQKPEARSQIEDIGANAPISPEPAKAAPAAVIGLPTVSDGDYPVSESDIAEWTSAFPAVDVPQQLAVARQWLIANPTRRKTKRGMRKFIVSWLDRRQNSGPAPQRTATGPPPYSGPPRTVGELAIHRLQTGNFRDEPTSRGNGYLDASEPRGPDEGSRSAKLIALATAAVSRGG
jgi:hypothetical protein